MNKKLVVLFIIAFLVRLIGLSQSLWLDEATTARVVKEYSYLHIITQFSPTDFHPPLYYLLLKLWTCIFGSSEISLRFPSVVFSLLTGYVIYLIGKRLKNESVGFWSAIFFLFNPLIIYYSQEARMYMMVTFLLTCSLLFFLNLHPRGVSTDTSGVLRPLKNRSRTEFGMTEIIIFNVFVILSFYTFYGSVFFIAALFLYLLYKKQYKQFFISFLTLGFALLIISPLLYQQFLHSKEALKIVVNWQAVLGQANLKNLLLIPLKFTVGRISFYPKVIYYLISAVWAVGVIWGVGKGAFKNKSLLFFLVFPIILAFIFSFTTPLLQYFRFIYLIPVMSLLLAFGLRGVSVRYFLITGFIIWSLAYLLNPSMHREDWKGLTASIPKTASVFMIASSSDPLKYYRPDVKINDLTSVGESKPKTKEIVVIPYTADIYGLDYKTSLMNGGFFLKKKQVFRGLELESWVKSIRQ